MVLVQVLSRSNTHQLLHRLHLTRPIPLMQHMRNRQHIHRPHQRPQLRGRIQDIRFDEMRREPVAVTIHLVPDVPMTDDVHGVETIRRRAVGDEAPEVLPDEAADVEAGAAGLEFLDYG